MRKWSDANCIPAGRPALKVQETEGTPAARLELRQSRVDAVVQSSESVPYTMSLEPGVYTRIGKPLSSLMIAMAFPKDATVLRAAIVGALKASVADGTYSKILAAHDVSDNDVSKAILAGQ
jgi:polar amino acid transport system substrate-binding protein